MKGSYLRSKQLAMRAALESFESRLNGSYWDRNSGVPTATEVVPPGLRATQCWLPQVKNPGFNIHMAIDPSYCGCLRNPATKRMVETLKIMGHNAYRLVQGFATTHSIISKYGPFMTCSSIIKFHKKWVKRASGRSCSNIPPESFYIPMIVNKLVSMK